MHFLLARLGSTHAPPARPRQRDHLRRRAALHRADAARPVVRRGVRPLEDRRRASRRRVRRRRALRRHPGRPRRCAAGGRSARSSAALLLLAVASFAFASADSAVALGVARFVQGIASTATWAGALAWISVEAPRERRGEVIGTTFGVAIFGAVLGPVFGGLAELRRHRALVRLRRRRHARLRRTRGDRAVARVAETIALAGPHARAPRPALPRRALAEPAAGDALRRPRRPGAAHARRSGLEHARDRGRLLRRQPRGGRPESRSSDASATAPAGCCRSASSLAVGERGRRRARSELGRRRHRRARRRRDDLLRQLLHARDLAHVAPRRRRRPRAGPVVRRDEHRLGVRRARRPDRRAERSPSPPATAPRTSWARRSAR